MIDDRDPTAVSIRPMRRRHLRSVMRIEQQVYDNPWSTGLYLGELSAPQGRAYNVATRASKVVGYGGMMFVADEAHVTTLAVHPEHQGRQIGARLLLSLCRAALAESISAITLEVRADNHAALALYRRFGLAPAGIRRGYYKASGADAIIMWAEDVDQPAFLARLDGIDAAVNPSTAVRGAS